MTTPHRAPEAWQGMMSAFSQQGCRFSAASLAGPHAPINQDSYSCRAPDFFAVADGVGGGALGEVASAMLIRQLGELQAPKQAQVTEALRAADEAIAQRLVQEGQGPGAAVCAAVWRTDAKGSGWLAMTVGDCKAMVASWTGSAWRVRWESPNQSYLYSSLTPPLGVPVDAPANMVGCGMSLPALFHPLLLADGERIVLCSDGFHNAFSNEDLQDLLNKTPCPLDESSAQAWCQKAQERGALDDVTVVIVESGITSSSGAVWWWALVWLLIMVLAFLPWVWL